MELNPMIKYTGYLLLTFHIVLWLWAVGGMMEWLLPDVPWPPYSNPDFPEWLLFFHWLGVIIAATGFIYGYLTRWKNTPKFMIFGYSLMAAVCVTETFGYMTSHTKYLALGLELSAYIILLLILNSASFQLLHFNNSK
jgi:hypothetical protein